MISMNPATLADMYKIGHFNQYPKGTTLVYSNLTPRKSRIEGIDGIVFFGLQYFIKHILQERFQKDFFDLPLEDVVKSFKRVMDNTLGKDSITTDHIESLHRLGFLPIRIRALPEGTVCPIGVPCLTVVNTLPEFYWLTNFLETILSTEIWMACTSATTSREYRKVFSKYAMLTTGNTTGVQWQAHDFSMRGMSSLESAMISGAAHLLSFTGSDTIPALHFLEHYYGANSDNELVMASVAATEHSVQCAGGELNERETYRRLLQDVYPNGIVSIVSDTWDYYNVLTNILPSLKEIILARDGKCVIRPDSSPKTPLEIICGDPEAKTEAERKGSVELLWDTFGGTVNELGYKVLNPKVGLIYGEAIVVKLAEQICIKLMEKGFASTNCLYGIGSMSFSLVTRDVYSFAVKSTYVEINDVGHEIYKSPKTDGSKSKKSLKGLLVVEKSDSGLTVRDQVTKLEESGGELKTVFEDGVLLIDHTLQQIRDRVKESLEC